MFLTHQEIKRLTTRGTRKGQLAWLRENGYPHDVNAAGWPVVLREYVEKRLGGGVQSKKAKAPWQPDLRPRSRASGKEAA